MQQQQLFEYAVIRIVPKVEREEFLNAGVILYCTNQKFLQVKIGLNEVRLSAFCSESSWKEILQYLNAIERICEGDNTAGPIRKLDLAGRFRWLTAIRSTIVQTSKVHPGFCTNPEETILKLYNQLVL